MSTEPDRRLERLAGAVADDTPVDWEREVGADDVQAPTLEALRSLATLAAAHRRFGAPGREPEAAALFSWGPLRVLAKLGEGAYGEVYRAWDPALHREVALKLRRLVPDGAPAGARRWLEEARRLARVRHPNVLVVHGADTQDGRSGIWTDLIHGRTLEDLLQDRGAMGPREAALVGIDLCGALAAVHAAGLVHGDVKTRNVVREGEAGFADGSGRIVLMDFGSAHDAGESGFSSYFGTPLFAAPEVLEGGPASPASDLYSLGVVLFRLVTLRYPVESASLAELHEKLSRRERTPLRTARPDLSPRFVQVVERALNPDPRSRFGSAAEMEQALAGTLPRTPRAILARPTAVVVALAVVAVVALALFASWLGREQAPPSTAARAGVGRALSGESPAPAGTVVGGEGRGAAEPPVLPALGAPQVDATLFRVDDGAKRPLHTGDAVGPGDALCLEIDAREPVFAYALDEDESGTVFVLFPLRGRGASNPLAAGERHRLPGREGTKDLDWQVTSAGGRETILILAAREPLAAVEEVLAAADQARPGAEVAYPSLSAEVLATLRGVGGLSASEPARADRPTARLASLARSISQGPQARSIWVRLIVLVNPIP